MTTQIKKPLSTHLISSPLLFFFIIITTLTLLSSSLSSASSTAPFVYVDGKAKVAKEPNEVEALLKWKTILHIKSQSVLSSWAGNTACNWVGISCDEFGSIINLNLSSHGLRGVRRLKEGRRLEMATMAIKGGNGNDGVEREMGLAEVKGERERVRRDSEGIEDR
ncbi:hypothetical protein CFP56_005134 [Quercus suber]|uniref:Leucine-rich repeat-containing N-terminal plant-type domain-containing protein n=1 Tax=Quercus suber TaxID=58331 RepID=A0AAW0LBV9_QUESU